MFQLYLGLALVNSSDLADIVRARVRTFGVEEHKFILENGTAGMEEYYGTSKVLITLIPGANPGSEWYIYDVGGSRSMVRTSAMVERST